MRVRELRVGDLTCQTCKALSGELCVDRHGDFVRFHHSRIDERDALAAEGWQWQEVNPKDVGAPRKAEHA